MNPTKYLADTNAFIYLLQKHPGIQPLLQAEWVYSFITEIELLGKPGIKPMEVKLVRNMLLTSRKVGYDESINERTILLKQEFNTKTPDAIIAGTALALGLPLLTADTGFLKIKSLDIILIEL